VIRVRDPAFETMVEQLSADDPAFVRRMNALAGSRTTKRTVLAVLLWTIAPVCIVIGGGTGLLMGLIAAAYGAHLMWTRSLFTANGQTPTPRRRPGAPL
jgi:hypothetical protein